MVSQELDMAQQLTHTCMHKQASNQGGQSDLVNGRLAIKHIKGISATSALASYFLAGIGELCCQILILKKSYKCPLDPHINPLISSYPGPFCCSDTTRHVISAALLSASLSQRVSLTLQRKRTAFFLCLALYLQETDNLPQDFSLLLFLCHPPRRQIILPCFFHSCVPIPKNSALKGLTNSHFHSLHKCKVIKQNGYN